MAVAAKIRMVPRTYWYRIEPHKRNTDVVCRYSRRPVAGSASQQSFVLERRDIVVWARRFKLLRELDVAGARENILLAAGGTKIEFDYSDV